MSPLRQGDGEFFPILIPPTNGVDPVLPLRRGKDEIARDG
jgi:hypothetical protein